MMGLHRDEAELSLVVQEIRRRRRVRLRDWALFLIGVMLLLIVIAVF
jgi:predicted nucleic acid-binding Zn ribbon protein